jgi:hypothetical protein
LTDTLRALLGPDMTIGEHLPQRLTSAEFAEQVLGFEENDPAAMGDEAAAAPEDES